MPPGKLDGRMKGSKGLHKNLAFHVPATGPTGNLRQQLKGAFPGAKIRLVQGHIGINDAHQRHVGKMQSFRDHLGAEQDVNFAHPEIAQHATVIVLAFHGIGIHAPDRCLRKELSQDLLHFLSAGAGKTNGGVFAGFIGAHERNLFHMTADVAA